MPTVAIIQGGLRRPIEDMLYRISFEVAPLMSDTERVKFLTTMMKNMTAEEAEAFVTELRTND